MATGWGNKTWGASEWGDLSDELVVVSSVAAQTSVGNFVTQGNSDIDVNGLSATFVNEGVVAGTSALIIPDTLSLNANLGQIISGIGVVTTGSSATINVGNETEAFNLDGWGRSTWGEFAWGIGGTLLASGIQATVSTESVTIEADAKAEPLTVSATLSIDQVNTRIDNEVLPNGLTLQTFTGNEGTEGNAVVIPTGATATFTPGQATIDPTYLIGEGWGRDTFGNWAWGVNYSVIAAGPNGLSASIVTGNEDAFTDITVEVQTAGELQTAITPVGTSANADHEIAASLLISSAQGDTTIEGTALVEPTGISASINIGNAEAGLLLEVPVTGVSANINIGNEDTSGNANVDVTGIALTTVIEDIVPVSGYNVTGVPATFTTGTVSIKGNADVNVTGISLTTAVGQSRITAWAEVNTGTQVTWTEVDLAA